MQAPGLPLRSCLLLGLVTLLLMLPETLPVPVLKGLVVERFGVSATAASWFMAANLLGALLMAPWIGPLAERRERARLCTAALLLDALLMQALAHPLGFPSFLLLRVVEGAAHITALTLVMGIVADAAGERRGRALGCVGAGLTLGVALGAAIGGQLGRSDPLRTLHVASGVLALAAMLAWAGLPRDVPTARRPGLREVWAIVSRERGVRVPLLLAFVDRFTVGFFTTGFPLLLSRVHGVEPPSIGMLLAAFLLPFALLSWPLGRLAESWSRAALVAGGSLVYGLGVATVGVVPVSAMWWLMPGLGVASAVMFVPTLLWLLERAPGIGRTTSIAAFHGAGSLGFLLGTIACGMLVRLGADERAGYGIAFGVAGALEIVGAVLVVMAMRTPRA
jgi:predicted MFS family arabinose efflux permease